MMKYDFTKDILEKMSLTNLVEKYRELGIDSQIDYDKFYLYSIITHSTAIEGSTVTEIENQLLFDEGIIIKGRNPLEQQMNLDLKNAYEWGMNQIMQHPQITVDFLCTLSSKVMEHTGTQYNTLNGTFSSARGDIRLVNVTAGFGVKSYMNFIKVPIYLEKFCNELNSRRQNIDADDIQAVYELSFWAHYQLVTIHPWADGNGRTTRLLMNLLQLEFGVLPMKVTKQEKVEYIQSLVDTREAEDESIFLNTMIHLQQKHLTEEILAFVASMEKGGQKSRKKVDRKGGQKTRDAIIALIKENSKITSSMIAKTLGINRSAVSKHLKSLQQSNIILRKGPDKGGHWEIVKEN